MRLKREKLRPNLVSFKVTRNVVFELSSGFIELPSQLECYAIEGDSPVGFSLINPFVLICFRVGLFGSIVLSGR